MDLGSILLGVALLLVVVFIVARPWLEPAAAQAGDADPAEPLLAERERLLTALRDLDFDQATGKLPSDEYAAQRAELVAHGAAVLRRLDEVAPGRAPAPGADAAADLDAEIEQAIARQRAPAAPAPARRPAAVEAEMEAAVARRRQAPAAGRPGPARFCGQCGRALRPDDRFCGGCGAPVPAEQAAKG